MNLEILLLLLAALIIATLLILNRKVPKQHTEYKYKSNGKLLTQSELVFFQSLLPIIPPNMYLLSKVKLQDFIKPAGNGKSTYGAKQKINRKHVDFLLIEKSTSRILGVIELDGDSHQAANQKEKDSFLEKTLQQAEIPLKRIKVQKEYDQDTLRDEVFRSSDPKN